MCYTFNIGFFVLQIIELRNYNTLILMFKMEQRHSLYSRIITVEPMVFFLVAIQGILINLRTQYVEYRLAKNYNYTIPNIGSANSSCWLNETNSTENEIQETIAAETAM